MRKLLRDSKGAVTVFVSLLLIPAILISGTAVDLARLYTARSVAQDANQLAGNGALAYYDGLLKDIYGLYAVDLFDPQLTNMVNDYIEATMFGEKPRQSRLGTLQALYGSGVGKASLTPLKDLSSVEVLRRQIEEYAKLRAPVVIVDRLMQIIDSFRTVKQDAEIIEDKLEIEERLEKLEDIYKEIYDLINEINDFPTPEKDAFNAVNDHMDLIKETFNNMLLTRNAWQSLSDEWYDKDEKDDLEYRKYKSYIDNMGRLINGGTYYKKWNNGVHNGDGVWVKGQWSNNSNDRMTVIGLNKVISNGKKELEKYLGKLDKLIQKCVSADKKKAELKQMVDDLEQKVKNGDCSADMKTHMPAVIAEYRELLKYDLEPMAVAMRNKDAAYIQGVLADLDAVCYSKKNGRTIGTPCINLTNLTQLSSMSDYSVESKTGTLSQFAHLSGYQYSTTSGFLPFNSTSFNSTKNRAFYNQLKKLFDGTGNQSDKDKAEDNLNGAMGKAQDLLKNLTLTPDGALYYRSEVKNSGHIGSDGDWSKDGEGRQAAKNSINNSDLDDFGSLVGKAVNKLLLVTYDSAMFSNFSTNRGKREKPEVSMSGIPFGTDVNYFYQSEQEYLFNGNKESARANLLAASGLLFLVRFVFNYISTFIVKNVKNELNEIRLLFSWTGPWAIVIREVARVAYALVETAIDMNNLFNGKRVPLMKMSNDSWNFTMGNILKYTAKELVGSNSGSKSDQGSGISYYDYLYVFLLLVDGDLLAKRTADLIAWNVTNKRQGIGANEAKMSAAVLFDMRRAVTDFSVATTVDLRMLFLTQPFAQKGINGTVPPGTMQFTVTDYRGY